MMRFVKPRVRTLLWRLYASYARPFPKCGFQISQ